MENKRLIVFFAVLFSIVFSIVYYALFTTLSDAEAQKRTLYMVQVGLYKQQDSIDDMQQKLKKEGISSYVWKQGKTTAVVCGVDVDEKQTKKVESVLKKKKYNYIQKSVTITDVKLATLIDKKEYGEVLERIKDES